MHFFYTFIMTNFLFVSNELPDVSRSRHMQSGVMIKTIFIPLLDLTSCLYSCLSSLLLLSNCTDQTFIRSITDDQTRTPRVPLGSVNSFTLTPSFLFIGNHSLYCAEPIVQFWFHHHSFCQQITNVHHWWLYV